MAATLSLRLAAGGITPERKDVGEQGNGGMRYALSSGMGAQGTKRVQHFVAMMLIGDGVMALVHPKRDAHAWRKGPKFWRSLMEELAQRPVLTMAIGAAQIAGGIWWALAQEHEPQL